MATKYFLGRGCLFIGTRGTAGELEAGKKVHTPEFKVRVESEMIEHFASCDPVKVKDLEAVAQVMVNGSIIVDEADKKILDLALQGETTVEASGATFTNLALPTVAVGDVIPVPKGYKNLASLTLTDSTGTPVTLTAGTHYDVDLDAGLITIKQLTSPSIVQPIKAAGAQVANLETTSMGTEGVQERFLRFDGTNIAVNPNVPVIVDIYRASIKPAETTVKSDGNEVNQWSFEFSALADANALRDELFGKYGNYQTK